MPLSGFGATLPMDDSVALGSHICTNASKYIKNACISPKDVLIIPGS
jgi:hypothetical protein